MRQRVTLNRTQNVTNTQQNVVQRITFNFMNFSFIFAKKIVMKFEFNVEIENDDEKIKKRTRIFITKFKHVNNIFSIFFFYEFIT